MNVSKLVSIGMPVYNGEAYLEAAIRSNLAQTYGDFELIISDNASTDKTESICRDYESTDKRVRYVKNAQNIGAAKNYNRLFELARGTYFRWSNADDLVSPDLLARTLPILESRPDVVIAYGKTQLIDDEGQIFADYDDRMNLQYDDISVRFREFYKRVRLSNIIYGLMRSSAVAQTRLMGDGKLPAGDVSFMAAMILQGKFAEVPEILFFRRMHDEAFSADPDDEDIRQFWSGAATGAAFPHLRAELANTVSILRAPVPLSEKGRLFGYIAKRLFWQRKYLASDFFRLVSPQRD